MIALPFRILKAIVSALFAVHNRFVTGLLAFVALFGFWEIWDSLAKQPTMGLFQMKVSEYQKESLIVYSPNSMGNDLDSNYRAVKWTIGAIGRAIKAGFAASESRAVSTQSGARLDAFMFGVSRSLDEEKTASWSLIMNEAYWTRMKAQRGRTAKPREKPLRLSASDYNANPF